MYISNNSNSNIGMATVLQQQQQQQQTQNQKQLMKTLTNGSNNDATGNHSNKWLWPNQYENANLNMHYGMKSQQQVVTPAPTTIPIHATSHVIAANNTPSNYNNNNNCTQQNAAQPANYNSTNATSTSNTTTTTTINNTATTNTNNISPTNNAVGGAVAVPAAEVEEEPEIDIMINNVVCSFSVRCHLNLREIAQNGFNVEYRRENGMVTMKLRRPYTTASIWSSGRITCTGATSEEQAKIAARRYARCLEKLGFRARFHNFRVVNVLGTCSMPWAIKIVNFSEKYKKEASYEPELHPGVTYKLRFPKATLKIFSTGSITVTASCVANVQAAIEHIFPLVFEFRKERTPEEKLALLHKKGLLAKANNVADPVVDAEDEDDEDEIVDEEDDNNINNTHSSTVSKNTVNDAVVAANKLNNNKRPASMQASTPNMYQKKRLLNGGSYVTNAAVDDEDDADEPSDTEPTYRYTEYDDPEDLIEGPDDEDDDDM